MRDTLERLSEVLKDKGFNVTHQRLQIYQALLDAPGHPSAEDVYNTVRRTDPILSLATVYKTLEMFEKIGLVHKVNSLYNAARYDTHTAPHGHLICKGCGRIRDIDWEPPPDLTLSGPAAESFQVHNTVIYHLGLCGDCQAGVGSAEG